MDCGELGSTHLSVLVTAGLVYGYPTALQWGSSMELSPEDEKGAYQRGKPWGPEAARIFREQVRELTLETAGRVGAMLAAENRRSVDHRYDETEAEIPYTFTLLSGPVDPVVVLKALACYEYQSRHHPGWPKSEAYQFCQSLRHHAIAHLPGYEGAPWVIEDPKVFHRDIPTH